MEVRGERGPSSSDNLGALLLRVGLITGSDSCFDKQSIGLDSLGLDFYRIEECKRKIEPTALLAHAPSKKPVSRN